MAKRLNFYLTDRQVKELQTIAKRTGLSASEIIRRSIDQYQKGGEIREFNQGRPFHGSENVMGGKLMGSTDTDYFYFFCPKCRNTQILQILDFGIIKDGPVERYKKERKKAKRDFTIAFKLYCPECKLEDFVKISNIGWAGGKLKNG